MVDFRNVMPEFCFIARRVSVVNVASPYCVAQADPRSQLSREVCRLGV